MWHLLEGDTLKGPAWSRESYNLWFRQWFGKCKHPEAQFHPWNKEEKRKRETVGSQQRVTCSWDAFKLHNRDRSFPSMPSWPSVPGPPAGGSTNTHFLSFSEAEVCDQGAGGTGSLRPLLLAYRCSPSCCLFAWCPVCLGASLNHKATHYSGIAYTYCLTLT